MTYIYRLYDPKTGELVHEGTPGELVSKGVFRQAEEVSRMWTRQHLKCAVPRKWKVERRQKMPQKKRDPNRERGVRLTKLWEYSLYNAEKELICKGTASELVEEGYFDKAESVTNAFYAGQNARLGACRIQREKVLKKVRCRDAGARGMAGKPAKPKRLPGGMLLETPLQRDVHELCLYNEAARAMGAKELTYGTWKAAGAPERP